MALNSFENRVYDVELEVSEESEGPKAVVDRGPIHSNRRIVKFYRPDRWTRAQILEEHGFLKDLIDAEIPAIAPISFPNQETLQSTPDSGIFYALFPKVGGRAPDELSPEQLVRVGRLLGRIHNVGASSRSDHRIRLDTQTYGINNLGYLLENNWIPLEFLTRYREAVEKICKISAPWLAEAEYQRIHGDCHLGNLLWNNSGPFFLDFDDMVSGPPVQDIWLLIPGRDQESFYQRELLLEGYEEIRRFDRKSLRLIEPLRALRFIHYSAWIARRWEDPAFPLAFPQFGSHSYWAKEVEDLEEQLAQIESKLI